MTGAVPLGDAGLSALRGSLDGGAPVIPAHLVRGLIARLDGAEAERDRLVGENRALHEGLDYQAAVVDRVAAVADWALPVGPEVLRVALDPALSLQGAEEAAHAAAEPPQDAHGAPAAAPGRVGDRCASSGATEPLSAPLRASSDAATVAPAENGAQDGPSATETDWIASGASRAAATLSAPPEADLGPRGATNRPGELLTPDQWCARYRIRIHDPDGWRGRNGRPWTDRITLAEFQHRATRCTADQGGDGWERMAEDLRALTWAEAGT